MHASGSVLESDLIAHVPVQIQTVLLCVISQRCVGHSNKTVLKGGSPKLGESQGLGESLRLSPILGESLKLSPKIGESFRGELFNMKEL